MKQFDDWWESYRFDPGTIDQAFEDAFRAGMLAAADIADKFDFTTFPHIAKDIRKAAE